MIALKNLIFILFVFVACESPETEVNDDRLVGTWLAGYMEFDMDIHQPMNRFMVVDSNLQIGTVSQYWREMQEDQKITVASDSIHFPYRSYRKSEVQVDRDYLKIGRFYPTIFKKVDAKVIEMDTAEIKGYLLDGQWVSDNEVLGFSATNLTIANPAGKEKNIFCWDIFNYNGYKLLNQSGSFNDCIYPAYSLGLVHYVSDDTLILEKWQGEDFKKITYVKRKFDFSALDFPDFQLCNPYLYENSNRDWYYFKYANFEGGLYRLKQIYDDRFKPVNEGKNSGLVKVKFVVNCVGEIGKVQSETMNSEYERVSLNSKIVSQIEDILKNSGTWNPGKNRDQSVDTYKFLIFRINEGVIDEIFP